MIFKKLFSLFFMIAFLISCKGQEVEKKSYFLNYDFGGNYEIYVNGINLLYGNDEGVSHGYEYLNPLFLKKGKQFITMRYKPFSNKAKITPKNIDEIFLEIFMSENGENPPFKKLEKLGFPKISAPVDSLFYTWEFNADITYQNNELDNALDVSKSNITDLTKEVINKYNEVHNLINTGNINSYKNMFENSFKREASSMYYTEDQTTKYISSQLERATKSKGLMLPIQDYELKIHPNHKTMELILKNGKSPLVSKDETGYKRTFGMYLYKDKNSGELKIF
jgi:hypothetical protein